MSILLTFAIYIKYISMYLLLFSQFFIFVVWHCESLDHLSYSSSQLKVSVLYARTLKRSCIAEVPAAVLVSGEAGGGRLHSQDS